MQAGCAHTFLIAHTSFAAHTSLSPRKFVCVRKLPTLSSTPWPCAHTPAMRAPKVAGCGGVRTPDFNPTHPTPCAHQNLMCGTRPRPHGRHSRPTLRLLTDLVRPPGAKPIQSASSPRQVRTPEPQSSPSPEPRQTPGARLGPIHLLIQFHCRSRRCHPPVLRLKLPTRPHHAKHLGLPPPDPQARTLWFVQGIRPCPSRLPRGPTFIRLAHHHSPPRTINPPTS